MTLIPVILFTCYLLYKCRVFPALMAKLQTEPEPVKATPAAVQPQTVTVSKTIIVYESRTQLEARAANIMIANGAKFDVWDAVRKYPNKVLYEIIEKGY